MSVLARAIERHQARGLARALLHHVAWYLRFPARMRSATRISLDLELSRLLDRVEPGVILDVGAGACPYRSLLPASRLVAVDIVSGPDVRVISDVHDLACADGSFDSVIATEILEHCRDPRQAVSEMHRVLRKQGVCILTTRFIQPYHPTPRDYYRFTQDSLDDLFAAFTQVDILHHGNTIQSVWTLLSATVLPGFLNVLNPLIARVRSAHTLNPCGFLVYAVK